MAMKIILISGKAEAGKTTTANTLRGYLRSYDKRAAIVPYGAYVKHTAKLLFDWDGQKDISGRALLQHWGTDVVRAQDPEFWTRVVVNLARMAKDELDYFIVDDVRFRNEIEMWRLYSDIFPDILTIRVERPWHENALTPEQREHPSETDLDHYPAFDITIHARDRTELSREIWEKIIPAIEKL